MEKNEFIKRRKKYFGLVKNNSVSVFFAGLPKKISFSADYEFIVNKNFLYLTGISQEGSILVLTKFKNKCNVTLFISPFDETKEKWFGKKLTTKEASEISGITAVKTLDKYKDFFDKYLKQKCSVYFESTKEIKLGEELALSTIINNLKTKFPMVEILDSIPFLRELRSIKSDSEIAALKKAISITKDGIYSAMANSKPGMFEYETKYLFEYECKRRGSHVLGFPSILASGKNATCLHYPTSLDKIKKGDLILCDVGASYEGYSADITRTFPVDGKFTKRQKEIYEIVLACNKEMIAFMKPGMLLKDVKEHAKDFLANECLKHKLIKKAEEISKYYYHGVGHHLGLDTHDLSDDKMPLKVGCVITDEPGLYIKEEGIGVRIEDDILIGKNSNVVLTKDVVKEVKDIEDLMKKNKK